MLSYVFLKEHNLRLLFSKHFYYFLLWDIQLLQTNISAPNPEFAANVYIQWYCMFCCWYTNPLDILSHKIIYTLYNERLEENKNDVGDLWNNLKTQIMIPVIEIGQKLFQSVMT